MKATNVEQIYRLTPVQQGMLFHTLYAPEEAFYIDQFVVPLASVDHRILERAWARVVARHAILRTSFVWRDLDQPVQVVHKVVASPIATDDLQRLEASERQTRFETLRREERQGGFDLNHAPLLRLRLVRLADDDMRVVWTHHHLLLDGWSLGALIAELRITYRALASGDETALDRLRPARPFGDYVRWIEAQDDQATQAYWRQALATAPVPTPLGIDHATSTRATSAASGADRQRRRIDKTRTAAIDALAKRLHLTLPTLIQGAWALVLGRLAGRDDVVFGVTVSGRARGPKGIENMIGCFINTLPLRVPLPRAQPIDAWLTDLQRRQMALQQHEHSPLVEIRRWAGIETQGPLFESLFVYERFGGSDAERGSIDESYQRTNYPLLLAARPEGGRLTLFLGTDRRRIESQAAARVLDMLVHVLDQIASDPGQRLDQITLLDPVLHKTVLGWSRPQPVVLAGGLLHDLVETQAARKPAAEAVLGTSGERLTYAALDAAANRLAHRLLEHGVGPGSLVGVCLERSSRLVIALYATLKAGAAYLPLDPTLPAERLAFMARDAHLARVITEPGTAERIARVPQLVLDGEPDAAFPNTPPAVTVDPASACYVIYTSGSTGRPKGVVVPHRAAANRIAWVRDQDARGAVRFLQKTTVAFDVSVAEIFAPLATGGAVVLAAPGGEKDPAYLVSRVAEAGVSDTSFPPTLLDALLEEPAFTAYRGLRSVITGGETVPPELPARFYRRLPWAVLENRYGPTEATISVTAWRCPKDAAPVASLPIGQPIAGAETYVLDRELRPLPPGVVGELAIGGLCLALGYLGRPARTAAAFVPHPASQEAGARLYLTGDLARWRDDGVLLFAGRRDHQVKVRGYRVELGEIDAALAALPAVHQAATVDIESGASRRLIACIVPAGGEDELDEKALRSALGQTLPDYMLPSAFLALEQLPVGATGKVDREELRSTVLTHTRRRSPADAVAPRTPTEQAVAETWAEVLGLEQVSAEDDFFALGGHSLLATQVVSRLRRRLEVEVPVRALFDRPTVAELAAAIDASSARAAGTPPAIEAGSARGPVALSFAQERLWFLHQLEPLSPAYHIPMAVRLRGSLRVGALQRALRAVVRRHQALRTVFEVHGEQPRQVVSEPSETPLPMVDLRALEAPTARQAALERAVNDDVRRPFDLARGPLLRAALGRLGEQEHVLFAVVHHIVSDGWSMGVLIRELSELYRADLASQPATLPPLPVSLADAAVAQRAWLAGEVLAREIAHWQERLTGAPTLLEVPGDRPRPARWSGRGDAVSRSLEAPLADALRGFAREHGASVFMALLAALQTLLHRYTGANDLLIGTPVAGRDRPEIEPLIGLFVNTVVLRGDLSGAPSFVQLVARARDTTLEAFEHQELPFERIVETLELPRNLASTPLVQVLLVLQNLPQQATRLPGLTLERLPARLKSAKVDLTLTASDRGEGQPLFLVLEFASDLYQAATASRMLGHLETLLRAALADPQCPIDALPLITPEEETQLATWNQTATDYDLERPLHAFIDAQIARTPDAVALVFEQQTLTYGALGARAERLAARLRAAGVGPETLVGICAERHLALIIGLLAILRAGGAYVPLDPAYPQDRLRAMLEDAAAPVLLVEDRLRARLPASQARILTLEDSDHDSDDAGSPAPTPAAVTVDPENLAYVIFTSGSTGRPKGAANRHRAITNRLLWMQEAFRLGAEDRVLQKTPISFDVSVWELFWPLMVGARMVLARPEGHKDSNYLSRLIESQGITLMHFVPSMLQAFLAEPGLESRARSLRQVVASGEALPLDLVERFYQRLPHSHLANLYGPTEAAVDVTAWGCQAQDPRRMVPIGRPIANTHIRILDHNLRPVPIGIPGELMIGGVQLARGYHRRPALTACAFLPDPAAEHPGARLYATGDLARWRSDGTLEYLGRIDHQVKIRGFRIELGEIEAVLAGHESVRETVVVARREQGDARLVAYLVAVPGATPDVDSLRAHLRTHLPEYMIPSAFVVLDAMPLSPNGKVDRKVLPAPERSLLAAVYRAPQTPTEEVVAALWEAVLGGERVGSGDSFFSLGGHSLLATRVMTQVRQAFGIELPLRALFETPTVAGLARTIDAACRDPALPAEPALEAQPEITSGALSFAQERLWFLDRLMPGTATYNIPIALRLRGALDAVALGRGLASVVERHAVLRTTFALAGGKSVQRISASSAAAGRGALLRLIDLRHLGSRAAETAVCLAHEEARRAFDLASGPLLRARLLRIDEKDHVLAVTMHHIAADEWSIGVLMREVAEVYRATRESRQPRLAPLGVQYLDVARWQRSHLSEARLDQQLEHWRVRLAHAPRALELPTDFPRPAIARYRGGVERRHLASALKTRLEAYGRQAGTTRFMVVLAAWSALLGRHAGQDQVVVGTPIAGRGRAELEPLIGFFINTLPLVLELGDDPSFDTLTARSREALLDAHQHQDIPFERLVEALQPQRDMGRAPLFQTLLIVLQDPLTQAAAFPGIEVAPLARAGGTAKFDLTLSVHNAGDGLGLSLEYDSDLFRAETAARLLGRFETLLAAALEAPAAPLSALPLAPAHETRFLLTAGRGARRDRAADCLPALIAAQAARAAHRPALADTTSNHLTYGELRTRVYRLAGLLKSRGAGPKERVGIFLRRGVDMVVAALAVLETGAAYVPLDPAFPRDRLVFIAGDAGLRLVISERPLASTIPTREVPVVLLDPRTDDGEGSESALPPAPPALDPDSLAYMIYTSGSTGLPKGVGVPHRALSNFLLAMCERPGLSSSDTLLAVTTLSFDIAALELYAPLVAGGQVVVASRAEAIDGPRLASLLEIHAATVMQATPASFRLLLATGWQGKNDLRLLCGGEPLAGELATALLDASACLFNLYGPTETTVWSTVAAVARDQPITIGTPIAATEVYVTDPRGALAPAGIAGELLIGGQGVARGYIGHPGWTAERFVPDPFAAVAGARLYRTGDLARWRDDGQLECLGRIDHQVKIRGFRIEPGEIEACLTAHPGVQQAAVVAQDDSAGGKRLAGFVVAAEPGRESRVEPGILRAHLRNHLPAYMVPSSLELLTALPLTPNDKVDRKALMGRPALVGDSAKQGRETTPRAAVAGSLETTIAEAWCHALETESVSALDNFFDLGGHSLRLAQVHAELREKLDPGLEMVDLFRFPTIRSLAQHIDTRRSGMDSSGDDLMRKTARRVLAQHAAASQAAGTEIAVIAMAGRFPGAGDVDTLWQRLCAGDELISFFDDETLRNAGVDPALLERPQFVKARGLIEDADRFDAAFFGYTPREAQVIDPQQRVFLECAWEALERGGYDAGRYPGRIGIFAGIGMNAYLASLLSHPALVKAVGRFQVMISNDKDFVSTRVAYKLGLTGPSITVQTACSTSLVAAALACDNLITHRADMMLAGGVTIHPGAIRPGGYLFEPDGIQSPDGSTRAFDARAQGMLSSNGAAVVLLKRLADAQRDGDSIHAVIKGRAINNDGVAKIGYTAPSVDGQAAVIAEAIGDAGIDPDSIGYVETHGTGTPLGDPIEVAALTRAFRSAGATGIGTCAIGSIKSNIGHTDAAAGVSGLIKAVLAVEHGEIPASLHFETPNPEIAFATSPFVVAAQHMAWPIDHGPRRAGVSALGIGGTNAHIIVEQAPPPVASGRAADSQLILLSARTPEALEAMGQRLAAHLEAHPELPLADVAFTLQAGRQGFEHRLAVVATSTEDAASAVCDPARTHRAHAPSAMRRVVFLFPGGGAQYPNMGLDLYRGESVYRQRIDRCCELLGGLLGCDLRETLFPPNAALLEQAQQQLRRTRFALPALFATEYALACLWRSWGIEPAALIGHSLGEYTAAAVAGVLSLEDALALVAERGRLFERLPAGAMLSVALGARELEPLLGDALVVAAINTPSLAVASGPEAAIERLAAQLAERGIEASRLHIDVAAHSPAVEGILGPFARRAASITTHAPQIPVVSNVSGTWLDDQEATDPGYWPRHLRGTVRFADGLACVLGPDSPAGARPVLLEVGPGRTLATLARQHPAHASDSAAHGAAGIVTSMRHPSQSDRDVGYLLDALGRVWLAGAGIDWQAFERSDTLGSPRQRLVLPTYPFERKRFWVDPAPATGAAGAAPSMALPPVGGGEETEHPAPPVVTAVLDTSPRTPLERQLAAVWQRLLGVSDIGIHDDFFELGGSSLLAVRMRAQLSEALGQEISLHLLLEAPTIDAIAARLEAAGTAGAGTAGAGDPGESAGTDAAPNAGRARSAPPPPASHIVPLLANDDSSTDSAPLFLVHPVGGHVLIYRHLAQRLGNGRRMLGLRARGTEEGEQPLDDLVAMAALYVEQVRSVQPHGPYCLAGNSMGGNIAFEMAQQLVAAGDRVEVLALLDAVGPGQMPNRPQDDVEVFDFLLRGRLPISLEALRALDQEARLDAVLSAAKAAGALAPELGIEGARHLLLMIERHLEALFSYQHQPYPGRLLFYRAAIRRRWDPPHPERPWVELAQGGIEIHVVPGDHLSMLAPPQVETVAAHLGVALDRLKPARVPSALDALAPLGSGR